MAQIQFIGNVGKDAELRHTQHGQAMLTFSVAESKSRRLDDGSWEKLREQWFNVTMFGPAAEALQQHILKGARVQVAGEFWRRDYDSQNGSGVSLDVKAIGVDVLKQAQQQSGTWHEQAHQTANNWGGAVAGGNAWGGGSTQSQTDTPPPF